MLPKHHLYSGGLILVQKQSRISRTTKLAFEEFQVEFLKCSFYVNTRTLS